MSTFEKRRNLNITINNMQNEQLNERYEQIRQYLLSWGNFHPDTKANCMQILEKINPELRKHLISNLKFPLKYY